MYPCRCGYLGDPSRAYAKAPRCVRDYMAKISGPLLDRFDMMIEVSEVPISTLSDHRSGETSQDIPRQVQDAHMRSFQREKQSDGIINAQLDGAQLETVMQMSADDKAFLTNSAETLRLSTRGYHRVMRVVRSVADLDGSDTVSRLHIAQAMYYRSLPPLS